MAPSNVQIMTKALDFFNNKIDIPPGHSRVADDVSKKIDGVV